MRSTQSLSILDVFLYLSIVLRSKKLYWGALVPEGTPTKTLKKRRHQIPILRSQTESVALTCFNMLY